MLETLTNVIRSVANQRIHYAEFERGGEDEGKGLDENRKKRRGRD